MLKMLRMRDVGPAPSFEITLSDRLNIFTGDNGLGKTFILDVAWWALTGTWSGHQAAPHLDSGTHPLIAAEFESGSRARPGQMSSEFDFAKQEWPRKIHGIKDWCLVVYARIDGGFSVWDPARWSWEDEKAEIRRSSAFHFSPNEVWDGFPPKGEQTLCNGLIRDWAYWQIQNKVEHIQRNGRPLRAGKPMGTSPFDTLEKIVEKLASTPGESIGIGEPVRLSVHDVRDHPTLAMPYGDVPLVLASAGQKRIASFAYLLTWAWHEHRKASQLRNQHPVKKIVLLVDELESHLHPRWQRTILPSILGLGSALQTQVNLQVLATTHSPLILASIEPHFAQDRDSLYLLELARGGKQVNLRKLPWARQGDAVGWLTSPVFGLDSGGRSPEAEIAIEAAEAYMRGERKQLPPGLRSKPAIQKALERTLSGIDPFWPRWIVETHS